MVQLLGFCIFVELSFSRERFFASLLLGFCLLKVEFMGRRGAAAGAVLAVFVACVLLFSPLSPLTSDGPTDDDHSELQAFGESFLSSIPPFVLGTTKTHFPTHVGSRKQLPFSRKPKSKGAKISIFTGRGAVKNQAIFKMLDSKGPLSIGVIQRTLNKQGELEITYYASLNKRMHVLVKGGFCWAVQFRQGRSEWL